MNERKKQKADIGAFLQRKVCSEFGSHSILRDFYRIEKFAGFK